MRTTLKLLNVGHRIISRISINMKHRKPSVKHKVFLHRIKICKSNL
nr:MAG TPA: hypothetical protein [Caudoviricetes sp.]